MFTKVSVSCLMALAAVAQAALSDILPGGQYGYKNETGLTSTVTVSPVPVTSTVPSGTAPAPVGPIESRPAVPISTGVSPTSKNSPIVGTGSPSGYAPVGSGLAGVSPVHGPYPIGTGSPISGFGPIGTGLVGTGPIGTGTGASTAYTTETIDSTVTSDTTLTYTVGSGASKTVVTTTVRHTSTRTQFSVGPQLIVYHILRSNIPFLRLYTQPNLPPAAAMERNPATNPPSPTPPSATTVLVPSPPPSRQPPRRLTSSLSQQPQAVVPPRMTAHLVLVAPEAQAAPLKSPSPYLAQRRRSLL